MKSRIYLALDGLDAEDALRLTKSIGHRCHGVKIHALYDREGPSIVERLEVAGANAVWVDAKLHDTKETVRQRAYALAKNGADIITVHASGGISMMEAAVEGVANGSYDGTTEIWAITVLTSLDADEIGRIYGREYTSAEIVLDRALMARQAGCRGIVCSAKEVGVLAKHPALAGMSLIVPGTRSAGVALGQQKRSSTHAQAIADGATYLVAGSQVTKATDPFAAFEAMAAEIGDPIE